MYRLGLSRFEVPIEAMMWRSSGRSAASSLISGTTWRVA